MSERKQGRRSAQTAEETKCQILCVAGDLFCELGYERVSLRNISEQAGVSHSLIRHHFGSKENIWYAVNDALHKFITEYIEKLTMDLPKDKATNIQFYQFMVRLLALLLIEPKPVQFVADTVRQEGAFVDYFLDKHGHEEEFLVQLQEKHNNENPDSPINLWEIKWLLINSAHAAASLKPVLNIIWKEQTENPEQILYNHWELFNKQMAALLGISKQEVLHPNALGDLLLPYKCEIKPC
jgi:AcrR family transcriptional regulator